MLPLVVLCAFGTFVPLTGPDPPIYVGVAARDASLDARAERVAIALGQALEKRGVLDLGSPPLPDTADGDDPILASLVATARAKHLDGDFSTSLEKIDDAIARFEARGAFREGASWSQYAEALVIRSLALRRLGREPDADAALAQLAAVLPEVSPDPEITPPKIAQRHQELLLERRRKPRVQIEIASAPPGVAVLVDGKPVGRTPLVVRDLLPGVHFVALSLEGERVERKLSIASGTARVDERVGDPRAAAARALRATVSTSTTRAALLESARSVGGDALVGVLVPSEGGALVVLGRVRSQGFPAGARRPPELTVAGVFLADDDPVNARAAELADALLADASLTDGPFTDEPLTGPRAWVGDRGPRGAALAPSATPEEILLGGPATTRSVGTSPPAAPGEAGGTWLLVGVGAGAAVAVAAAVAVGAFLATGAGNQLEVTVDASNL